MTVKRYLSDKVRSATKKAAARLVLDILDDLEKESHNRTHELNLFNSGVRVNIDVAERKLYGAIRRMLERKTGVKPEPKPQAKAPNLDPAKEVKERTP